MKNRAWILCVIIFSVACNERDSTPGSESFGSDSLKDTTIAVDTLPQGSPGFYDFSSFIPEQYIIKDSVVGNLNLDEFPDAILVLQRDNEEYGDQRPRPVLILIGDSSGIFQLALRNDHLTPPREAGQMFGEPYAGIEIDSGTFRINHYGGSRFRWTYDYVFEYNSSMKTWYYTTNYASMGDMLGEMNELTETGQCIPYDRDTLYVKKKIDVRRFDFSTAPAAEVN